MFYLHTIVFPYVNTHLKCFFVLFCMILQLKNYYYVLNVISPNICYNPKTSYLIYTTIKKELPLLFFSLAAIAKQVLMCLKCCLQNSKISCYLTPFFSPCQKNPYILKYCCSKKAATPSILISKGYIHSYLNNATFQGAYSMPSRSFPLMFKIYKNVCFIKLYPVLYCTCQTIKMIGI